jgi:hypothetical protein
MAWTFKRSIPANDASAQSVDYISWSQSNAIVDSSRSISYRLALFPVVLGVTASVVAWILLQVLVLAVAVGVADYSAGRPGLVTPTGYAVLSAGVAGLSVGSGAAVTLRRLLAVDADEKGARVVAFAQCAVLSLLVGVHGLLTARPSPVAVALLLAGAAVGGYLGALRGLRPGR